MLDALIGGEVRRLQDGQHEDLYRKFRIVRS